MLSWNSVGWSIVILSVSDGGFVSGTLWIPTSVGAQSLSWPSVSVGSASMDTESLLYGFLSAYTV